MNKSICVIGMGYIGLPTATMFAQAGYNVVGVDVNVKIIDELNEGNIIIEEPFLKELVKDSVISKNLRGSICACNSDIFIIAVPTPIDEDKKADMKYVISACNSILPYIKKGDIVILESTSPVGTTEEIIKPILQKSNLDIGSDIFLGYCPERVIPGKILHELKHNNRIIGGVNKISCEKIKQVYLAFVKGEMYLTDTKTAEMCKLMENTYRDVNIALANELAKICEYSGINVWDVIKYCNKHPRVNIHNPGPGVGGHCLAVDPWFIVEKLPQLSNIIRLSRETNDSMPKYLFDKIENIINIEKVSKEVTILGMTYKANIDDIRESPIIKLIKLLRANNYNVKVYDPFVSDYEGLYENLYDACENSNIVILAVDHDKFKNIDLNNIKKVMKNNIILDTKNFFEQEELKKYGFRECLLGRDK